MTPPAGPGDFDPVLVVGTGMVGTSVGLALRRAGAEVLLEDTDPEAVRLAAEFGAGIPIGATAQPEQPRLVVVAVPPAALADRLLDALRTHPEATVTDVGSVKSTPLAELRAAAGDHDRPALRRYVGSHPMAGSERSGPMAASAELFDGRSWAVCPHPDADPDAVAAVEWLAEACRAVAVRLTPAAHDQAVARISHLPHVLSVLAAGRLVGAPADHLALAGQGLRDVTRVAAGAPGLWEQILAENAAALLPLLHQVRDDLDGLLRALDGEPAAIRPLLEQGQQGTAAIPGKHGTEPRPEASVVVVVPDRPGELARLFADTGDIGVNIEDVRIDHDPARPYGVVELVIRPGAAPGLVVALQDRGWTVHR